MEFYKRKGKVLNKTLELEIQSNLKTKRNRNPITKL